jgi:hypothetical protein
MSRAINRKVAKIIKSLTEATTVLAIVALESPTKWDLISFYHANPFSIHTAKGLANMIGRSADQIFQDAEELASLNVLEKVCETGNASSIYSYEPTDDNAALLGSLLELADEDHSLIEELLQLLKEL